MKDLRNSSAVCRKQSSWENVKENAYVPRVLEDI